MSARPQPVQLRLPFARQARMTQGFGERPEFYRRWGLAGHNGIDWALPLRTPILAADAGMVVRISYDPAGFGLYIKLRHRWGETLYAHLSRCLVETSVFVQAGQEIALSGHTGVSTGPHLHFGVKPFPVASDNGYFGYVDPLGWLERDGCS